MESFALGREDVEDESAAAPTRVHYSTGRLAPAQAEVVDHWRARLLKDRPLPGQRPTPLRLFGMDDRPRASSSDAVAAAVRSLLQQRPPAGLDLTCYAEAGRLAVMLGDPKAPTCQPVSFYLPQDLHAAVTALRVQAVQELLAVRDELRRQAIQQFPGDEKQQALWVALQLRNRGLPPGVRQVPRGAIARMSIDRWRRRAVDWVAAEAAEYAAETHLQVHHARRDMRKLRA